MTRVRFPVEFEDPSRQKFTANGGTASSTITRLWELVVGRKATGLCCAPSTASTFKHGVPMGGRPFFVALQHQVTGGTPQIAWDVRRILVGSGFEPVLSTGRTHCTA